MSNHDGNSSTWLPLTSQQLDTFLRDGVLVVDHCLSPDELSRAHQGLARTLAKAAGVNVQRLRETGAGLQTLSSTNGSGGVLDVFYEEWKLEIATRPCLLYWTQQLWKAAYVHQGEAKHNLDEEEAWKWHPFGAFDPSQAYAYIDRIGYRLPTSLSEELGQEGKGKQNGKRRLPLQRGLTPHLDCCPDTFEDPAKPKWRPIQCFVSLTDNTHANTGGFEAVKGFHRTFNSWAAHRPPTVVKKKGSSESVSVPAPCVGDYTHIRPKEDADVMQKVGHIPVRAGSVVFFDNRIVHANAYRHEGDEPRSVVYCSFLPNVAVNRMYVQEQLNKWKNGQLPTDQWITTATENDSSNNSSENEKGSYYRGESLEDLLPKFNKLQRQLFGIEPLGRRRRLKEATS